MGKPAGPSSTLNRLLHILHALCILAWGLLRSIVASATGQRRGIDAFRASYVADRLPALDGPERASMVTFSRCIACGLCDVGEGARRVASKGRYAGVMDLMLASSRSMPDFDAAAVSFDAVGDPRLAELEGRCPTRVPMREIARFVRKKAREAREMG
jgi:hypothetical protein